MEMFQTDLFKNDFTCFKSMEKDEKSANGFDKKHLR